MKFLNYPLNVVIPAGASGIGESIARVYIEEGCNVFICDVSNHNINLFKEKYPVSEGAPKIEKQPNSFSSKLQSPVCCLCSCEPLVNVPLQL